MGSPYFRDTGLRSGLAMEFCLGCGSNLPSESRYVRRLVAERSDLSRLRSGVVLAWRNLMKEALEENSGPHQVRVSHA